MCVKQVLLMENVVKIITSLGIYFLIQKLKRAVSVLGSFFESTFLFICNSSMNKIKKEYQ